MADIQPYGALPGTGSMQASQEAQVWVGRDSSQEFGSVTISSTARDAGNSTTTLLRPGLLMGLITTSQLYKQYDPAAVDGSEIAVAVLSVGVNMLDSSGVAANKFSECVLKGILQPDFLINVDAAARRQMICSGKFFFSDDVQGKNAFLGLPLHEIAAAANTTLNSVHAGALIVVSNTATLTLPALNTNIGYAVEVLNNANTTLTVASAEGANMIGDNGSAFNSVAFSTTNHKIGGRAQIIAISNAGSPLWTVRQLSSVAMTFA